MCTKDAPGFEAVTFPTYQYESKGKIWGFGFSQGKPRRDEAGRAKRVISPAAVSDRDHADVVRALCGLPAPRSAPNLLFRVWRAFSSSCDTSLGGALDLALSLGWPDSARFWTVLGGAVGSLNCTEAVAICETARPVACQIARCAAFADLQAAA